METNALVIEVVPWFFYGDDQQPWVQVKVRRKQKCKGMNVVKLAHNGKRFAKSSEWHRACKSWGLSALDSVADLLRSSVWCR